MGAENIFFHSHRKQLHDKEGPGINMPRCGRGVHDITHLTVYG